MVFDGPERKKMTKLTCLNIGFENNDQLNTKTALQMQAANLSAYGGDRI